MDTPEKTTRPEKTADSSEAFVGIGITVASMGVLLLLLGWAQWMREVASAAIILCAIGALLLVVGCVMAGMAKARKSR